MAKKVKTIKKNDAVDVLQGSTKFRTEISLLTFRFDPHFMVSFLKDIAPEIDKGRIIQISQGTSSIVVLGEEGIAEILAKKYQKHLINHKKDLVALVLMSPKKIVDTPGVLSFILNLLSKNKVNVVEIIGCYTDTTFVIHRKDLFNAMELLGQFVL